MPKKKKKKHRQKHDSFHMLLMMKYQGRKTFDSPTFYLCTTSLLMLTSRVHMIHMTKSFEASIHLGIECSDMKHDLVTSYKI